MNGPEDQARARFELLLRKYDELDQAASQAGDDKAEKESARDNVKSLLKDEVVNMGLGKRTKLAIPGIGDFSFTTERYYRIPAGNREEFAILLISRSLQQKGFEGEELDSILADLYGTEVALFTIGKGDLNAWCKERVDEAEEDEQPLPGYITHFEDKFVPRISLASAKARRQEKAAQKAARSQQRT